jgi:phenylalanyl-tRNA synthetase beta chain
LRSESSYRFERGADVEICDWASQRAAQLILETAGGQLTEGVVDVQPKAREVKTIELRYAKTEALLGIAIPHSEQVALLTKLGITPTTQTNDSCAFTTPSWRVDLKREVDLIEELERLHGLAKTPATPPRGAIGANAFDSVYDQISEVRRILTGLGLNEAQGQTLVSRAECRGLGAEIVPLANPLSADMDVLRPSLLPGLIHSLRHNVRHKNYDVALFEIGRVFAAANGATKEERRLAIALTGQRARNFWSGADREAKFEVADLKGLIEELLEQFGVRGVVFTRREGGSPLFLESAGSGCSPS